jgi:hypothetical protein
VAFLLPLAGYLVVAALLELVFHSVIGDASSREANAYYVFFSNDPHLAAMGFVWNPLTSLTEMPLILLKGLWPALTVDAFASGIMSSIFMAGTCYQLFRFMEELGLKRTVRWFLLAAFAVNPIVVFSGGNGMSEALFLFTLVATTRYLARWLVEGRTRDLMVAGIWLALAYADRNEAAMAAFLSALVVLVVSYRRSGGSVNQRRLIAVTDSVLFTAPFALSFLGWAAVSWIIVGHPFEQFSSVYGTSSQLKFLNAGQAGRAQAYTLQGAFGVILAFAPLIPLAALGAVGRAWHERDLRILPILSVLGGVLTFEVVAFCLGAINIAERYFIYAIPLMVLFAAVIARPLAKSPAEIREERQEREQGWTPRYLPARRRQRRVLTSLGAICAVAMLAPGLFTTYHEMFHTQIGSEDAEQLAWILHPGSQQAKDYLAFKAQYAGIKGEADRLDGLDAGKGGIMVDDAVQCVPSIILASKHPGEFTIPNDVNYTFLFGAPYQDGIRYLLVSDPHIKGGGALDSLDRQWPNLYDTGAGVATLVTTFSLPACTTYRLYRVTPKTAGSD